MSFTNGNSMGLIPQQNVKVIIRTKPTGQFASENISINDKSIDIFIPKKEDLNINNQQEYFSFDFDDIMHNASQELVYDECAADMVDSVLAGHNSTIMTYGQISSGKTFTMTGSQTVYKQRGIAPRSIHALFDHIQSRPDMQYNLSVTYLEVYNETLRDLLDPHVQQLPEAGLHIDANGMLNLKGLTKVPVLTEEQALACLLRGDAARAVSKHELNSRSSRSHCIFTVHVTSASLVEDNGVRSFSKLTLVDLAGSERVGKTHTGGLLLTEAKCINKSLSFLEQIVGALGATVQQHQRRNNSPNISGGAHFLGTRSEQTLFGNYVDSALNLDHVPFRRCKLTNVLRDAIGGFCRTRLIATVCVDKKHLEETLATLRFAQRMRGLHRGPQTAATGALTSPGDNRFGSTNAGFGNTASATARLRSHEQGSQSRAGVGAAHVTGSINMSAINMSASAASGTSQGRDAKTHVPVDSAAAAPAAAATVSGAGAGAGSSLSAPVCEQPPSLTSSSSTTSTTTARKTKSSSSRRAADKSDQSASPPISAPAPASAPLTLTRVGVVTGSQGLPLGPSQTHATQGQYLRSALGATGSQISGSASSYIPTTQSPLQGLVSATTFISSSASSVPSRETAFAWYRTQHPAGIALNTAFEQAKSTLKAENVVLATIDSEISSLKSSVDAIVSQIEGNSSSSASGSRSGSTLSQHELGLQRECRSRREKCASHIEQRSLAAKTVMEARAKAEMAKAALGEAFIKYYQATYGGGVTAGAATASTSTGTHTTMSTSPSPGSHHGGDLSSDVGERFEYLLKQTLRQSEPGAEAFYTARKLALEAGASKPTNVRRKGAQMMR